MRIAPLLSLAVLGGAASTADARPPLPSAEEVAGWLRWVDGRICRDMIDDCLDEDGNALFELPEYKVSKLRCAHRPRARAACSFTAEAPGRTEPSKRCSATFKLGDLENGKRQWELDHYPFEGRRRRLSPDPILKCN